VYVRSIFHAKQYVDIYNYFFEIHEQVDRTTMPEKLYLLFLQSGNRCTKRSISFTITPATGNRIHNQLWEGRIVDRLPFSGYKSIGAVLQSGLRRAAIPNEKRWGKRRKGPVYI
jgi:hypothetical protein